MFKEMFQETDKRLQAAQATIADLQEKIAVERANKESAVACVDRDVKKISALQQRVAQLESMLAEEHPGLDEVCDKLTTLQADHATLLGLVMKLPVVPTNVLPNYMKDMRQYDKHDYSAFSALLEYRASLPAQPAQGGELCTYCKLPLTKNHSFSYGFPGVPRVYRCDRPSCVKPNAEGETRA